MPLKNSSKSLQVRPSSPPCAHLPASPCVFAPRSIVRASCQSIDSDPPPHDKPQACSSLCSQQRDLNFDMTSLPFTVLSFVQLRYTRLPIVLLFWIYYYTLFVLSFPLLFGPHACITPPMFPRALAFLSLCGPFSLCLLPLTCVPPPF